MQYPTIFYVNYSILFHYIPFSSHFSFLTFHEFLVTRPRPSVLFDPPHEICVKKIEERALRISGCLRSKATSSLNLVSDDDF
jgi:hypothetical protein